MLRVSHTIFTWEENSGGFQKQNRRLWNFSGEDRKTRHLRECWRIGTRRERRTGQNRH